MNKMSNMPSVAVKDLRLTYGSVEVLKQLNLDIAEGEFIVLLGPSGCGKSTLLNCIAGLLDITDGQIFIKGKNVTWEEPKDRGIGMVFQSYALYPQMTVRGNLSFGLKNAGLPKAEIDKRIKRASEILQIEPLLDRKPAALSGGQRQRVAIGRALVRDVDVFLFDEPLSNLDAKLRSELRVEIKRLHQNLENTMIYVTHDQIEALTLADRIAVMRGGIIQQLADPKTIYNKPSNLFVAGFIGSPAMTFLEGRIVDGPTGPAVALDGVTVPLAGYDGALPGRRARRDARRAAGARGGEAGRRRRPAGGHRHRRADGVGQPALADLRRPTAVGQDAMPTMASPTATRSPSPSTYPRPRSSTARANSACKTRPGGHMLDLTGDWTLSEEGGGSLRPCACRATCIPPCSPRGSSPTPTSAATSTTCAGWPIATGRSRGPSPFGPATAPGPWSRTRSTPCAEVRINGHFVIAHATAFRDLVVPIADAVVPGENRIEILLRSATREANALQAAQPFPVPYHAGNCPIPNGNMLRKPQCDFGWDWNLALAPVGVYGRIGIVGPEGCDRRRDRRAAPPRRPGGADHRGRSRAVTPRERSLADRRLRRDGARRGGRRQRRLFPHRDRDPRPRSCGGRRAPGRRRSTTLEVHAGGEVRVDARRAPRHPPGLRARRRGAELRAPRQRPRRSSAAAPTGSRPTPCPAASPKRRPAPSSSPPPTPT